MMLSSLFPIRLYLVYKEAALVSPKGRLDRCLGFLCPRGQRSISRGMAQSDRLPEERRENSRLSSVTV